MNAMGMSDAEIKAINDKYLRELKKHLKSRLNAAMLEAQSKAKRDMEARIEWFYMGGTPVMYERTYAMRDTPNVSALKVSGTDKTFRYSFEAYLNTDYDYDTGKSPNMGEVLSVANDHGLSSVYVLKPMVGNQGFWDMAVDDIQKDFFICLKKYLNIK